MVDQGIAGTRTAEAPVVLRVLAYIADLCVASTVVAIALIINNLAGLEFGWLLFGIGIAVAVIASIVLHASYGASPGKALADLRVVDADAGGRIGVPASAIRSVVFTVLAPLVYLPGWSVLADSRRRGLHEKASGTKVVDGELDRPAVPAEWDGADEAAESGPLGGLVAGEDNDDDSLRRIPTPLPGGTTTTVVTATDAADATTTITTTEPRERLQPPTLPPLPDDVPGLRPIAPRFGPPVESVDQPPAAPPLPPQPPVPPQQPPQQPAQRPGAGQPPQGYPPQGYPQQAVPSSPPPPPLPPLPPVPAAPAAPPVPTAPSGPPPQASPALQTGGARPAGAPIVLRFDDGHAVDVRGDGIIGREPVLPDAADASTLTKHVLVDNTASVSKTHLMFGLTRGELWVEDVGSTNGSAIAFEDSWAELTKGVRYAVEKGSVVHMGQRSFKVYGG